MIIIGCACSQPNSRWWISEGRLFLNLREDKGYTYGSLDSSLSNDKYSRKVRFRATLLSVQQHAVTDSSVVQKFWKRSIEVLSTTPVSEEELANAKAGYAGSFVSIFGTDLKPIANFAYQHRL